MRRCAARPTLAQAERVSDRAVPTIYVRPEANLPRRGVEPGRVIEQADLQWFRQGQETVLARRGAGLLPLAGYTLVRRDQAGKARRIAHPDAAMAAVTQIPLEQRFRRRIVEIDRVLVVEVELDEAQRIARPRKLHDPAIAADHVVAAQIGGADASHLVPLDRFRHRPGR